MKIETRLSLGLGLALLSGSMLAQPSAARAPSPRPKTYGVDSISYYRMAASEFTLLETSLGTVYNDQLNSSAQIARFSAGTSGLFVASPHLPSGALITYFELDSCDEDASTSHVYALLYPCDDLGNCSSAASELSSENNVIACGYTSADVSSAGLQVDNYRNQLTVLIQTTSGTNTNRFAGVILGYKLQVSPAPPFADFGDVPTDHPYFQFIEALSASGITAGCGNGDYCPDRQITRGEMAVFLAKALGLQWP